MSNRKLKSVRQAGFTLIELLIVLSIFSMLMVTIVYSIQTFSRLWLKSNQKYSLAFVQYKNADVFTSAMHALVPFEAKDAKGNIGFYFLGSETGFTGVTDNGVFNTGKLSVFRVLKEQNQDGSFSLFYEEAPLNDYPLVYSNQEHKFNFRLEVLSGLQQVSFSYLGWDSYNDFLEQKTDKFVRDLPVWHSKYDGMVKFLQPSKVKISIDGFEWQLTISDRTDFLISRRAHRDA